MKLTKLFNYGIWIFLVLSASAAMGQKTALLTLNSSGTGSGNGASHAANITPVGRYLVFTSSATDLGPNVTTAVNNIYVQDLKTGTNQLVSVNSEGTDGGNGGSIAWAITPNGRFVMFISYASNLVPDDDNSLQDIFVRDLTASTTTRIEFLDADHRSASQAGAVISSDGRFVIFTSAVKLVLLDNNDVDDVFVFDMATRAKSLISVSRLRRRSGNRRSTRPQLTPDGRYVIFDSDASDLVDEDKNGAGDIFVRDLLTNTTRLVSTNYAGTASANGHSNGQVISADGRYLVFYSSATNLVAEYLNQPSFTDIYHRDLVSNTTSLVSVNSAGTGPGNFPSYRPTISGNGRFVVFQSEASDLVANDSNKYYKDIFVRDMLTGTTVSPTVLIPQPRDTWSNYFINPIITNNGRFLSYTRGLDPDGILNIVLHDLVTGTMSLASANREGTGGGNRNSIIKAFSSDETSIYFTSAAGNLVQNDGNDDFDVYVYRIRILLPDAPVPLSQF